MQTLQPHHLALIQQRLPDWLTEATKQQRQILRKRVQHSHKATRKLHEAMTPLESVEAFCRPLLNEALARWYPDIPLPSPDTAVLADRTPAHRRMMSWLEAAMQNMADDTPIRLYASEDALEPMAVDTTLFVKGVRNLDLGQRYLNHLRQHIDTDDFRALLRGQDHAAFAAELTYARLQGRIDSRGESLGEAALAGSHEVRSLTGTRRLQCGYLSVLGVPLSGPLLVRLEPRDEQEPCLLYLPADPSGAVRQYPSLQAAGTALTHRLWQEDFRLFFNRFVSHAQQPAFAARLRQRLYPRYPYALLYPTPPVLEKGESVSWIKRLFPSPHDVWQETLDKNARLTLTFTPWTGDCFEQRASSQVQVALTDAVTLVVPTARFDAAIGQARLLGWLGVGLTALNVASLFVPALGELMLVVGGAQIVNAFLEGVHALNEGETDAAIGHLFDVFDNLVQIAVLGAAHAAIGLTGPLENWTRIPGPSGQRLWHADLLPFSREAPWPPGAPATKGLHHHQGRPWLTLEGNHLPLEKTAAHGWRLATARGHQYQPRLLGNGHSPWLLEHEQPLAWTTARLMRRIGNSGVAVSDETLLRALRSSSFSDAAVRRVVVDQEAAPALLLDNLQALGATDAATPGPTNTGMVVLGRDFPSLSLRAKSEILAKASNRDLDHLQRSGRLPIAIAQTARLYLREARINRALLRFYQDSGPWQDRDALALGCLEQLPGWSNAVRIELREGSLHGRLINAAGPRGRPVKTLVRHEQSYQPYDEHAESLSGHRTLYQALLDALPDSERTALNLQIHDPLPLRDALFEKAAADRDNAARLLGMAPVRKLYQLPTRLLETGRIGYPLSGRGQGWANDDALFDMLFPSREPGDREWLRYRLRQAAGDAPGAFTRLLEGLRTEYQRLGTTLDTWVNDAEGLMVGAIEQRRIARTEAACRIRQAWRRESPQVDQVELVLEAQHLGSLPTLPVRLTHVNWLIVVGSRAGEAANLDGFLQAFPGVRHLDLSSNLLRWLPEPLTQMTQLESLDLSENFLLLDTPRNLDVLAHLPRLQRLNLTDALEDLPTQALERLGQLQHLYSLQADLNNLVLQAEHFDALQGWPALTELSLGSNEITLTPESRTALARLNHLQSLRLGENPLRLAPDVTGWQRLHTLDLDRVEITQWPVGLVGLMDQRPLVLRSLDLSGNRLVDAPELRDTAFAEAIRSGEEGTYYDFDDNPFDEQAQLRLVNAGLQAIPDLDVLEEEPWALELPAELDAHRQAHAEDPAWSALYRLVERMVQTPDYQSNPTLTRERIVHVLSTLTAEDLVDGETGWGRAQLLEQVTAEINDAAEACVDQASLLFQRVETQVAVWRCVATSHTGASDEAVAVSVVTSLARQACLDERVGALYNARRARRQALSAAEDEAARQAAPALLADDDMSDERLTDPQLPPDEIEIALVARIALRERLSLPDQPAQIAFGYLAQLSEGTLEHLAQAVLAEVDGAFLARWASEQPFWRAWVQRLYPEAFQALAREWQAASEYYTDLTEPTSAIAPYTGPAVPPRFIEALERETSAVQGLRWRIEGILQRIDLVSGRYSGESELYERAGRLLLSTRRDAQDALYRQLAMTMFNTQ
ncbi:dermonecrotic toxin domain-containing protein [Pseudomonas sp. KCJK8670]|uniref:dermonecrotic toxin domain-containing protein n=1 Tax=Pseudomonas sp. KCJK8670 TaxID=3344558 RepID=UPI0039059763